MQLPFAAFTPQKVWTPPRFEAWPKFGRAKGRVCIDLETKDDVKKLGPCCFRKGYFVAGVGIGIDNGPKAYIPLRHLGGDNVESEEQFWKWFQAEAAEFEGDLVNVNIGYDLKWCRSRGVSFNRVRRVYDVITMETLHNELHRRYDLDSMAQRWKVPGKNKQHLIDTAKAYGLKNPMAEMWKLPARDVADYNIGDLDAPLAMFPRIYKALEQMECIDLLEKVEAPLTPILVDMFMRGLRVNEDKLDKMDAWYKREEERLCEEISAMTLRRVTLGDCSNNNRIGPILEEHLGISLPRVKKGKSQGIKLDDMMLSKLDSTPLGKLVHRARKVNKARTFVPQTWDHLVNGRIHCSYNQNRQTEDTIDEDLEVELETKGARTGRMSCDHTNLTQQPSRDDWAKNWRDIYEPEEGQQWWSSDFAQQEPRITTMFAARMNLPKARETAIAYLTDELLDNHSFMAKLTGLHRKRAKNIYLGLVYGMGEAKLCRSLQLPTQWCVSVGPWGSQENHYFAEEWEALSFRTGCTDENVRIFECAGEEGKKVLDTFFKRAPFLKMISAIAVKEAKKYGFVRTMMGRHIHFPMSPQGKYEETHAAFNGIVQGSAADQMKYAMVLIAKHMPDLFMQLQVHDMVGGSVPAGLAGRRVAKEVGWRMRNAFRDQWMLFRVDSAVGPSWGKEHDMCYQQYCTHDAWTADEKYCPTHNPRGMTLLAA